MHVAYLADDSKVNGFYRGHAPMATLDGRDGIRTRRLRNDEMACPEGADALLIHRYCEIRALGLARDARARGAAVIWDNDDHQGAMPKSVVTHKHFSGFAWEQRRQELQRLFEVADLVTTPSRELAASLREIGATRTTVIENYVPDQYLLSERRPHERLTIGWVAGLEHQMDVERVPIVAALQRLLDERADVEVVTVGLRLGLRSDRYQAIKGLGLLELSQQTAQFDIAIAPLADIAFSRSRSNVKLKEYAAAGTPWLASPVGPYLQMGERQGGRLVGDEDWHEALSRLLDKPRERRKLAKAASKWVRGETLSGNVHRWATALRDAVEHASSGQPATAR